MKQCLFSLSLLVFPALLVFACATSEFGGEGANCTSDEDCNPGLACNSMGQCITVECTEDNHCNPGYVCSAEHACVPEFEDGDTSSGGCQSDLDCPGGTYCSQGGDCRPTGFGCAAHDECPIGWFCGLDNMCHDPDADGDTTPDGDTNPDGDTTPDGDEDDNPDGDEDAIDGDTEIDAEEEEEGPPPPDSDNDGLPDPIEDKDGNGRHDPGETDLYDPDTDNDGLLDGEEDRNHDGVRQFTETDPLLPDTDYDEIIDGEEDANHNGVVDATETDPLNPDTDSDNVIDGNELSGGYTAGDGNSDPLDSDTDNDTLPDGVEDANHNGVYEPELGETDPTLVDSDGDGTPDNEESVNLICQDDQITTISLHSQYEGDWTLALLPDFDYSILDMSAGGAQLVAAAFEDSANGIAGFILSRAPTATDASGQVSNDNNLLSAVVTGNLNHRGRIFQSYDGFDSMTSHYTISTSSQTVGSLRNNALAQLSGRSLAQISGLPAGPIQSSTDFEIITSTVVRDSNVLLVFTVLTQADYDSTSNPQARYRALDVTDGSALGVAGNATFTSCDAHQGSAMHPVDFLWVVDDSGSMNEDQQAVADAASLFATIMTAAGVDFRVAVTSTGTVGVCPALIQLLYPWMCAMMVYGDPGALGQYKFTSNTSEFEHDVQNPPGNGEEYGLLSGQTAIDRAMNSQLPANERLRPDASLIVLFLSDEEDQDYEDSGDQATIDGYKNYYAGVGATCFAIVGDIPSGCGGGDPSAGPGSGEAGEAYIEVAYHTGGSFASICSPDLTPTMNEILRAAAGTASVYELTHHPISATIQVMVEGQIIQRSQTNGFEYDMVSENIVFYGTARPNDGDDVVVSYRYYTDDPKNTENR